ncbi:MAG: XrtA/PEP-CTERM system exopolysaccharide export protein [Pseudohongiellaceae bacterium]
MIVHKYLIPLRRYLAPPCSILAVLMLSACSTQPVPETERFDLPDYNYVVGPGDVMEIFVWGHPDLSTTGIVRPDGKLTTRLVEDMPASGRTPTELAREIEESYAEYVRDPVVTVIVQNFVGVPEQQVSVIGEAANPASIPYARHMTLLDLMIAVGGMTEFAAGNRSVLLRSEDGQRRSYKVRLDDLLKKGDITANLALEPGDIVVISESWF